MIMSLNMMPWIWLALTVLFFAIEALTFSLTSIWFAFSALILTFLSFLMIPLALQFFIFTLLSGIFLCLMRPLLLKKFKKTPAHTNADSLLGKKVTLIKAITKDGKGEIKLHGITWSCQTEDESPLAKGDECKVTKIEGNTVIVKKTEKENA
ncbi:MAG: NfeD family protein [Treponemataceae bacterium]